MAEKIEDNTPPTPPKTRGSSGQFMSKEAIEKLKEENSNLKREAKDHLVQRNKALMQGTKFDDKYFKGMKTKVINQFLVNFHKQNKENTPEPEIEPNTPIIGTPIGSGKGKHFIDKYLKFSIKNGRPELDFDCPASVVFGKHENKTEALNKWLAPQ